MEKSVVFRDYQKAQTTDFNNIQLFAQQTFDDIVGDTVTGSLRYAGFNTVQSNTAEITVSPGRFYGMNNSNEIGAVFSLPTQSVMSLVQYLCISQVTQKVLTLVCYGVVDLVDVQTRDFLTNTQTLQTQPQAVAMTSSRDAVLGIVAGAESGTPNAPVINVGQVPVATILVNSNGIVSIAMLPAAQVTSTEVLNERLAVVESFDASIAPRVSSLASDIASLANQLAALTPATSILSELIQDVALLKARLGLPSNYAQYGASYFLYADPVAFDITNSQALGFNCTLQYGVRFPPQNANVFALSMFNPIDPNATYNTGSGLLLPAYTEVLALQTGVYSTSVALGQYGYQTFTNQVINIPYYRLQYGGTYYVCTNGASGYWAAATNSQPGYYLPNYSSYTIQAGTNYDFFHGVTFTDYLTVDSWTEPYWTLQATNNVINGALIAQSFLVSSDMWITSVGIYIATIASPSSSVIINLCQCTNGQPDLTKVIASGVIASANLVIGMNYLKIPPAFAAAGSRMAVTVISNANHQLGLAQAGSYLDGTFFYSLDGAYFLGDFTKEMVLAIKSAQFTTNQTTIQFAALNLAGGIRAIDLTARMVIPSACQLTFETQEAGSGTWLPVAVDPVKPIPPFADAPVLLLFRARFIGSPSIMPGIMLPDSIMRIWCPGPTFTFVSTPQTLITPATSITVQFNVQNFNPISHSLSNTTGLDTGYMALYTGGPLVRRNPTSYTVTLVDASSGSYNITAIFTVPSTSTFTIVAVGTTNSVASVFLISQMLWWV